MLHWDLSRCQVMRKLSTSNHIPQHEDVSLYTTPKKETPLVFGGAKKKKQNLLLACQGSFSGTKCWALAPASKEPAPAPVVRDRPRSVARAPAMATRVGSLEGSACESCALRRAFRQRLQALWLSLSRPSPHRGRRGRPGPGRREHRRSLRFLGSLRLEMPGKGARRLAIGWAQTSQKSAHSSTAHHGALLHSTLLV